MKVEVLNQENKSVGHVDLPDRVFAVKWNPTLVHQVVVSQLSNIRKPVAHTKDRSEVRGGGKKPWKQKHTGRARHGSSRSPLWAGGGVTFGPRNDKDYTKKINKKMKQGALYSVLSKKLKDGEIKIIDVLKFSDHKTKLIVNVMKNFFKKPESVLFITLPSNKNLFLAGRNIKKVGIANLSGLNVYECLKYKFIFIEKETLNQFSGNV